MPRFPRTGAPPHSNTRRRPGPAMFAGLLAVAAAALLSSVATAGPPPPDPIYRQTGYWEPPYDWAGRGTHMALLRGTDSHSQIIFWHSGDGVRIWKWNPGDSLSASSPILLRPTPGTDVHCAGESMLTDGRLYATGGNEVLGIDEVNIYDPVTTQWTQQPLDMEYHRWYPTNTTLADGRVLITAGLMFQEYVGFGGRDDTQVHDDLAVLGMRNPSANLWIPSQAAAPRPSAREDHTAIFDNALGATTSNNYRFQHRTVIFGGRSFGGPPMSDVWALHRSEFSEWSWTQQFPAADALWGAPAARSGHAAAFDRPDSSMVVIGGTDAAGQPLGDVWKLFLYRSGGGLWARLFPAGGDSTLPRSGHTVVYDAAARRVILFGGRSGAAYHNDVWQLSLSGTPAWTKLVTTGTPPAPREGHAAQFDTARNRMIVYGGRNGSTPFGDGFTLSLGGGTPQWAALTPAPDAQAGTPAARFDAAAAYDAYSDRLLIHGGDTDTTSGAGAAGDFWAINFWPAPAWRRHHATLPAGGRAGHAALLDPRFLHAPYPEIYDPDADTYTLLGDAQKVTVFYPNMYLLPGGKVLMAGAQVSTFLLNLSTGQWETPPWTNSGFSGFTATMYRPGMVLKCGGAGNTGASTTKRIDLSGDVQSASWQSVAASPPLIPRVLQNLVVLPTGDVLATGGMGDQNVVATAVRYPQIWSPVTDAWTDSALLAPDPCVRDYHSSSILLPDGRILSAGGELNAGPGGRDKFRASIFWPPYLFDAAGAPAARPEVTSSDSAAAYGAPFSVCTPAAASIQSVCLMRPAATTHGVDMEARYVPLGFSVSGNCLSVTAPPDGNTAPPGLYLLYLVTQDSVPSIGRWIRLGAPVSGAPPAGIRTPELSAYPNPFRAGTRFHYVLDRGGPVSLVIVDVAGRVVRSLLESETGRGAHEAEWNGLDDRGAPVAAGVYFARLSTESGVSVKKVTVKR